MNNVEHGKQPLILAVHYEQREHYENLMGPDHASEISDEVLKMDNQVDLVSPDEYPAHPKWYISTFTPFEGLTDAHLVSIKAL